MFPVKYQLLKFLSVFIMISLMVLSACKSDKDDPSPRPETLGKGFFVVNEGNFTVGNASLSFYSYDSVKMFNNLFYRKNNVPLGDVALGMAFFRNMAFIVVNNSGLIQIIDKNTGEYITKVSGLLSPRQIHIVNAEKAYLSDLQNPNLIAFNPNSLEFIGEIPIGKSSEAMVSVNNKLFVANWSDFYLPSPNNTLTIIDWLTDEVVDQLVVGKEPNSMVIDKEQNLWVLCSGGFMNEEKPALYRINPVTHEFLSVFEFPEITHSPQQLTINAAGDTLYFLNNGVNRMKINDLELPEEPFIPQGHRLFYALAVEPQNGQLFVTDAVNYIQNGFVFRFMPNGTLIDSIQAGIIPGQIRFN